MYGLLTRAIFTAKASVKKKEDPTQHEITHLPGHLQASVYRADLFPLACKLGDRTGNSCWLQFQCVPIQLKHGQGFHVQELLEALGHHDKMYSECYENHRKVNVYKAKNNNIDGTVMVDTRKKGPHYEHRMDPLPLDCVFPVN